MYVSLGGTLVWPKFWALPWGARLWVVIRQADSEVWRCFDVLMNFRDRLMPYFVLVLIAWLPLLNLDVSVKFLGIRPETAWRACRCLKAAHQCWPVLGVLLGGGWYFARRFLMFVADDIVFLGFLAWVGFLLGWLTDWDYSIICGCFVKNDHGFDCEYYP